MFGDMMKMMGKLKEAQKNVEETKRRLDTVYVDGEAGNGKVKVTATANREIKNIEIDDSLTANKEELQDLLVLALNNTLAKANNVYETEMQAAAKDSMPNIPGLSNLMK